MAAVGAGISLTEATAMVVHIEESTTDVLLTTPSATFTRSAPGGTSEMDENIIDYLRHSCNLIVGQRQVEAIRTKIGFLDPLATGRSMIIYGRNPIEGIPRSVHVTNLEIDKALSFSINHLVNMIQSSLDGIPSALIAAIANHGIFLSGDGALVPNLAVRIHKEIGMPAVLVDSPTDGIILTMGRLLSDYKVLREYALTPERR